MAATDGKCIYCSHSFEPTRGQGDHVLPAAIGEFEGAFQFRGLCVPCNNQLGRFEQQLLQCGPDSIFRPMINSTSKRTKRRGRSKLPAMDGVPTPKFTIDQGGYRRPVRRMPDDPRSIVPVDAMTVKYENGRDVSVQLFDGMGIDAVRNRLRRAGVDLCNIKEIFFNVLDMQRWIDLGRQLLPGATVRKLQPDENGVRSVRVRVESTVTIYYYQAIAKIAFHYYLATTPRRLRGDEPCFREICDFIMHGGEKDRFFKNPAFKFALPVGRSSLGITWLSMNWCHVLGARDKDGAAVAYVRLFVGPENVGYGHYITLGCPPTKILLPDPVWGHVYVHSSSSNQTRFAGRVVPASISRLQ